MRAKRTIVQEKKRKEKRKEKKRKDNKKRYPNKKFNIQTNRLEKPWPTLKERDSGWLH